MLCDRCRKREANIHVTQIMNGQRMEHNLCTECAREEAVLMGANGSSSPLEKIMNLLRNMGMVGVVMAPDMTPATIHGQEVDLDSLGLHLPGYEASGADLKPGEDVLSLKAELNAAVAKEDFERAALLRDEIFKLEHLTQKDQA